MMFPTIAEVKDAVALVIEKLKSNNAALTAKLAAAEKENEELKKIIKDHGIVL